MKTKTIQPGLLLLCIFIISSCKKILEVPARHNQLTTATMFSTDKNATDAVIGLYSLTQQGLNFMNGHLGKFTALYAGEIIRTSPLAADTPFQQSKLTADNLIVGQFWLTGFKYIGMATTDLLEINRSTGLSPAVRDQLTGELKFIRALCYTYLVNLFHAVPVVNGENWQQNSAQPAQTANAVYEQIIEDLTTAMELLPATYPLTTAGLPARTRPNKWTCAALLARIYLYQQNWPLAEQYASALINAGTYQLENNPDQVFLAGSQETIFQFQPVGENLTGEAAIYQPGTTGKPPYQLTQDLLKRFTATDKRKSSWIKTVSLEGQLYAMPYKYKTITARDIVEMNIVLRLGEQYLVLAEALAEQHRFAEALSALNRIRTRAGLDPVTQVLSETQLLELVADERYRELFTEWGHRWFDLRRTGSSLTPGLTRADDLMPLLKADWQHFRIHFPIPQAEIKLNPLLKQNSGY